MSILLSHFGSLLTLLQNNPMPIEYLYLWHGVNNFQTVIRLLCKRVSKQIQLRQERKMLQEVEELI